MVFTACRETNASPTLLASSSAAAGAPATGVGEIPSCCTCHLPLNEAAGASGEAGHYCSLSKKVLQACILDFEFAIVFFPPYYLFL